MGAGNVYIFVLSSWKVNIAENPIAVMGLYIHSGYGRPVQIVKGWWSHKLTKQSKTEEHPSVGKVI